MFGFDKRKIVLDKALYERAEAFATQAGYASVADLVVHLLEREIRPADGDQAAEDEEAVRKRLEGLGYID